MMDFVKTSSGVVSEDWIDSNGHMNVTAYMRLFDHGTAILAREAGITEARDLTLVAARMIIHYRKELLVDEAWSLWSGVSSVQPGSLTIVHKLRSTLSVHATCHIKSNGFSKNSRSAILFDTGVLNGLSKFLVPGLADRFLTYEKDD